MSEPAVYADILDALPASREMSDAAGGAAFCVYRTPEGAYAIVAGNRPPRDSGGVVVGVAGVFAKPPRDPASRANAKAAGERRRAKRASRV